MKNQSIVIIIILIVFAASAIGYSLSNNNSPRVSTDKSSMDEVPAGMHRMPDGSLMGNPTNTTPPKDTGMDKMNGMDHSAMMVKSEREFLEGMIPHHQEAVDTAKEVIARGGSTPEIKQLAQDIVLAQEKEIAMMKGWYQSWYGQVYVAEADAYTPMMRDLATLNGAALDKIFIQDMIMHHMGAIMMAKSVESYIEHEEIKLLAKAIVDSQSREIEAMRTLLKSLQN